MPLMFDRRTVLAGLASGSVASSPVRADSPASSDLMILRRSLIALHPGLYRYQSPREFEARLATLERAWTRAPAFEARFLALSRFLAAIRCGHSFANLNNMPDAGVERLVGGRRLLPFHFRWIGRAMIVTADPHGIGLAPGSGIAAIDGIPSAQILAALMPYARADGGNHAKRRNLLSVEANDRFETFDIFHPLLFPGRNAFNLGLVDPAGRRASRAVSPIDRAARLSTMKDSADRSGATSWWQFEQRGPTAVLTMDNWAVYQTKWDWQAWLGARFAEMAANQTSGLIIDLRGNEGGIDVGDAIIAHLIDEPLAPVRYRRMTRFRSVDSALRGPLQTWDKSFFQLGLEGRAVAGGLFELPAADEGPSAKLVPVAPRFRGKVAVLIDAANSSATHQFAQRVQDKGLATLVGGETGGNLRGLNGGAFFFVQLADSGLAFDLPLIGTFPPRPMPDRGIVPDIAIPLTAAAIAGGRDPALAAALQAVRA